MHVCEWIDVHGQRQRRVHPTETAAETHATRLVRQGIRHTLVWEMPDEETA